MFVRTMSWKAGLLVVGLALALSPATAPASTGVATGILLEVLESPPAQAAPGGPTIPGAFPPGIGGRLAEATEKGFLAGSGTLAFFTGQVEIHAQSRAPVINPTTGDLGVGRISGVFQIQNGSSGVVVGKLDGNLDFTPTNSGVTDCSGKPCPFVFTFGSWSTLGKNRTSGTFSGVALIPFEFVPGSGAWFYLDPTGTLTSTPGTPGVVQLTAGEFSKQHATPLAKFLFTLSQ